MSALARAPLACPECAGPLGEQGAAVRCPAGHSFDVARQGYVNLSRAGAAEGDDAAMVAARAGFLAAGWFDPLSRALASAAADAAAGVDGAVVDLGAGTGHHLAAILEAVGERAGVALDASVYAARRAARAHPGIAAVVADSWADLPLRDGSAAVACVVFAPRRGGEIERVLAPGGSLLVAVPGPGHLAEVAGPLGLLEVDPRKEERLLETLGPGLARVGEQALAWTMDLDRDAALALAAMGPAARHSSPDELARRVRALGEVTTVTAAVSLSRWRPS